MNIKTITTSFALLALMLSHSAQATNSDQVAKRVIALSPHAVEMLYSIGAGETIVGTTDHADYPEAAKKIPRIGGYYGIQIERVLELKPDLIVVWQGGNKAEDIKQLKKLGYKVYDSHPRTLTDVAVDIEALGKLTGHEVKAHQVASKYLDDLKAMTFKYQSKTPLKVFYQLWSTPLMTVAKNSWIEQIIKVCHGDNIFADAANDYPQVSIENVLLKMPQVILQSQDKGNVLGVDWQAWPELPAVKHQHIYQLNADLLHRPTIRTIQGINSLCDALDKAR